MSRWTSTKAIADPPRASGAAGLLRAGWVTVVALVLCAGGCKSGFGPRRVASPDPSAKIPAIKQAVRADDEAVVPQLVQDLESDDPAVRFYAIEGLRRLTGEDHGYVYYAPEPQREQAVRRWKLWLESASNEQ